MPWTVLVPLVLLGLLLLLLPLRLGLRITGQGGAFEIGVQLGGLTVVRIRPGGPPRVKTAKKRKKEQQKEQQKADKQGEKKGPALTELIRISEDLGFLFAKLKEGLSVTHRRLLQRIVVGHLRLDLGVSGGEPMSTTLAYGGLSASVYGAAAALSHLVTLRRHDIVLWPAYHLPESTVTLDVRCWLRLWHLLWALFGYLAIAREVLALIKERKAQYAAAEQAKAERPRVR
ncbi:MAG: hypothetical protein IJF59_00655 [Clostridia bacterium]|nr:hypothetical protein [Clostridia bacterium]